MIIKYRNGIDGIWGFIDGAVEAATKDFDGAELIRLYELELGDKPDICGYAEGVKLDDNVRKSNIIFSVAWDNLDEIMDDVRSHCENHVLITETYTEHMPVHAILIRLEGRKEWDSILLITNQPVYLLNNEGKTIERLS